MPCFCTAAASRLPAFKPTASLAVSAAPPKMGQLLGLLGLVNLDKREDLRMGEVLPNASAAAWVRTTLTAAVPNIRLPSTLPNLPGGMLRAVMRLTVAVPIFPLTDPERLVAEIRQAVQSLTRQLMPNAAPLRTIPNLAMHPMTNAARLTLALRAKGVCPMALAGVDDRFATGMSSGQMHVSAAADLAARLPRASIAPFGLTPAQQGLAAQMALMAPLATVPQTIGLPPLGNPDFIAMLQKMLGTLASVPPSVLPIDELLALAAKLEALDTIREAFGEDALTSAGVARVNAMLNYAARMNLPEVPVEALALQTKLNALPKMENVMLGAQTAKSGATSLAVSLSAPPPSVPIVPALEALGTLGAVLARAMKASPFGPCNTCNFA